MVQSEYEMDSDSSGAESTGEKIVKSRKLKKNKSNSKRSKKGDIFFWFFDYCYMLNYMLDDADPFKVGSLKPEYDRHILGEKVNIFCFVCLIEF